MRVEANTMRIRELMTHAPTACEPTTTLRLIAQLMADHDCAAIPIVDSGRLAGIVTDRDIVCRCVAAGIDAARAPAASVMTRPVIALSPDDTLEIAAVRMEENRLHHLPVVNADGMLVGIVAQSDIGRRMTNREFGELARTTSIRSARRDVVVNAIQPVRPVA